MPSDNITEILKELVSTPSDSADENEDMSCIISYVSALLTEIGCDIRLGGKKNRPPLLARCGRDAEKGVLFSGHLDTVPVGMGWTKEQGEIKGGIMYGRGTSDMKAGCAAILLAAKRLSRDGIPFSIIFTTDEETTMKGAEAVAEAVRESRAVVIAEPTNFDVVFREKGVYQFSITTKGKSAHASLPWLGSNAIIKMGAALTALKQEGIDEENVADRLTINPDVISGGTKVNVIPDAAYLEVDTRFPASMTKSDVEREISRRLEKAGLAGSDYEIKEMHHLPSVEVNPGKEEIKAMLALSEGRLISVPYATEMVMFRPYNDKVMVCGPGEPKEAHVVDEKIRIADVERAADIYYRYALYLTSNGSELS